MTLKSRPVLSGVRRGHVIRLYSDGRWRWANGRFLARGTGPDDPACIRCTERPGPAGEDPCLGWIAGARAACCGHGVRQGYVSYPGVARCPMPVLSGRGSPPEVPTLDEALAAVGPAILDEHIARTAARLRALASSLPADRERPGALSPDLVRTLRVRWLHQPRYSCGRAPSLGDDQGMELISQAIEMGGLALRLDVADELICASFGGVRQQATPPAFSAGTTVHENGAGLSGRSTGGTSAFRLSATRAT